MSASWETYWGSVLTVILTRETCTTAWASNFRNLIIPKGFPCFVSGLPFAEARDTGAGKLLELGFEYLFYLDDDVLVPPDTILRLMSHKKPIVSGCYYRRNVPIVPVMLRDNPDGKSRTWITDYRIPELIEVDYVGAGCLLIHRDVLKNLPPIGPFNRWFEWRVSQAQRPEHERLSEDFAFCQHCKKNGFKIYVDTGIQAKHAGISASEMSPQGGVLQPLTVQ